MVNMASMALDAPSHGLVVICSPMPAVYFAEDIAPKHQPLLYRLLLWMSHAH